MATSKTSQNDADETNNGVIGAVGREDQIDQSIVNNEERDSWRDVV